VPEPRAVAEALAEISLDGLKYPVDRAACVAWLERWAAARRETLERYWWRSPGQDLRDRVRRGRGVLLQHARDTGAESIGPAQLEALERFIANEERTHGHLLRADSDAATGSGRPGAAGEVTPRERLWRAAANLPRRSS
jgi:hypothetical protein